LFLFGKNVTFTIRNPNKVMKTRYQVNQNVQIKGDTKKLIVIDFEIFEDMILYYTNDGKSYPENMLEENFDDLNKGLISFIKIFELIITNYIDNQQKNLEDSKNRYDIILEKIKSPKHIQEIKDKIKNYQI